MIEFFLYIFLGLNTNNLGSDNFQIRMEEKAKLLDTFPFSFPLLLNGGKNKDPEIAFQCNSVLQRKIFQWDSGLYEYDIISLLFCNKLPSKEKISYMQSKERLYKFLDLCRLLDVLPDSKIYIDEKYFDGVVCLFITKIRAKVKGKEYYKQISNIAPWEVWE